MMGTKALAAEPKKARKWHFKKTYKRLCLGFALSIMAVELGIYIFGDDLYCSNYQPYIKFDAQTWPANPNNEKGFSYKGFNIGICNDEIMDCYALPTTFKKGTFDYICAEKPHFSFFVFPRVWWGISTFLELIWMFLGAIIYSVALIVSMWFQGPMLLTPVFWLVMFAIPAGIDAVKREMAKQGISILPPTDKQKPPALTVIGREQPLGDAKVATRDQVAGILSRRDSDYADELTFKD